MPTQIEKAMEIAKEKTAKIDAAKAALSKKPDEEAKKPEGEKEKEPEKKPSEKPEEKKALEKEPERAKEPEAEKKPPSAGKVIDDLQKELRALKAEVEKSAEDKKRIAALEGELKTLRAEVKKPADTKNQADELVNREKTRTEKYLSEDKDLPREERREMSKTDLEEWFIEDPVSAQEWITTRTLRKDRERREDISELSNKSKATDIIKAQELSQKKVIAKHPDLDIRVRMDELKAEGKTIEEARVIVQKENPTGFEKAKIIAEIIKEDENKYFLSANGPELLMEEMERRMEKAKPNKKAGESEDERDKRIADEAAEQERQRQAAIDDPLKNRGNGKPEKEESDTYKKGLALYLRANRGKKTKADYDKILERRRSMPGADTG